VSDGGPGVRSGSPRPQQAPSGLRVPDFFIVGHQKCGTTALYLMLGAHPQIFFPAVKEPRYFAFDLRSTVASRSSPGRPHTLDGYLALFADARPEQLLGDPSPQYLRSQQAAGAIAEVAPDARMIAILREPASFLRSFHLQMVSSNVESERDLAKALALEPARREGKRIPRGCHNPASLMYSEHVRYAEQLRRFHEHFPAENVMVLVYEQFRADNEGTLRSVLRFLDVADDAALPSVQTTSVREVRSGLGHRATVAMRKARKNPAAAGRLARAADALLPQRLRGEGVRARWRAAVYREPPEPPAELMLALRRRFKDEVVAVSEYLGRDLVGAWGYDAID
jgi:hypothetical protein